MRQKLTVQGPLTNETTSLIGAKHPSPSRRPSIKARAIFLSNESKETPSSYKQGKNAKH